MCKKFFVSLMAILLLNAQAFAVTENGLKSAFDELNYALTVEWDQADRNFYNAQTEKFTQAIRVSNVTNQELVDFALSQIKDEKMAQDLKTAFTVVKLNQMNQREAQNYVLDVLNRSYSQGASWNGGAVIGGVILVVVFVAVALLVTGNARVRNDCYEVYQCDDYCTGAICYQDCYYKCI